MGISEYGRKRKFAATPEPEPAIRRTQGPLRFVVQKHAASHLHYDFRLELDGVLLSWAVPKGPSLDPGEKRLAMKVEDHPLEYRNFEGVIPAGNYGAGQVIIWDEGFYGAPGLVERKETERALRQGLRKGDLKFALYGEKLKGEFALVKIKDRDRSGKENSWLLIKKQDRYSSASDVTRENRSVRSGRTLQDLGAPQPASAEGARGERAPMPHEVRPMLATLADEPFDHPDWIFEIKWDGFRAIAETERSGRTKLYSRNLISLADRFPEVARALGKVKRDAVWDGEVVVVDKSGRSDFQMLQNHFRTPAGELRYYIFDLLYWEGRDLRSLPLVERKELLASALPSSPVLKLSEHIWGEGKQFYVEARRRGAEGILAKDARSPYRAGRRARDWLKVKVHRQQEAVIAGFTEPRGSRKEMGALVLGVYEGKELVYIGHTGGGLEAYGLAKLKKKLERLAQAGSPFAKIPRTNSPVTWIRPELVAEVRFQEWTGGGQMRMPIFLGLREDKPASEVKREKPEHVRRETISSPPAARTESGVLIGTHLVELSNLDKIYWPKEKFRKRDTIEYYRRMAPVILPYLRDRPENLHRHPDGIAGESFYQKNVDHSPPEWVRTEKIWSESNRADIHYLVCDNEATLAYLANLGCIELNPWLSRMKKLEYPDFALFDLDPEGIGFGEVVKAAQEIHKLLDRLGAPSYPKTSGATGLHIAVPLGAKYDYDQAKTFAEIVMRMVQREMPRTTSVERNPRKREKRVYLDFLQNRYGQTMVAPYSLRPRPGAPVSTPLEWKEVNARLDPARFNIKTIWKRLDAKGDLWKPVLERGIDLKKISQKLGSGG